MNRCNSVQPGREKEAHISKTVAICTFANKILILKRLRIKPEVGGVGDWAELCHGTVTE